MYTHSNQGSCVDHQGRQPISHSSIPSQWLIIHQRHSKLLFAAHPELPSMLAPCHPNKHPPSHLQRTTNPNQHHITHSTVPLNHNTCKSLLWHVHFHLLPINHTPPEDHTDFGAPAQRTPAPFVATPREELERVARDAVVETRRWSYHRRLGIPVAHEVGVEGWVVGAWHGGGHGGYVVLCFVVVELLVGEVLGLVGRTCQSGRCGDVGLLMLFDCAQRPAL